MRKAICTLTIIYLCLTSMLQAQYLTNPIYTQKPLDTIIRMKGDTVLGLISTLRPKKLKVWVDTAILTFKPEEIYMAKRTKEKKIFTQSYITTDKGKEEIPETEGNVYQLSKNKPPKGPKFLEVITDGEIALYSQEVIVAGSFNSFGGGGMMHTTGGGKYNNYYLVNKSTGKVLYLENSKSLFNSLFSLGKFDKSTIANLYLLLEDEPELLKKMENEKNLKIDKITEYIIEYNKLQEAKGNDPSRFNFVVF